jgi:hypothetical protein
MYHFPPNVFIFPGQVRNRTSGNDLWCYDSLILNLKTLFHYSNMIKYKNWSTGSIDSAMVDDVVLVDPGDIVIDAVSWGSSGFSFEPSFDTVIEGYSIERYPADKDHDNSSDWRPRALPQPGKVDLIPPTPFPTLVPSNTPAPCNTPTVLISEVITT